MPSRRFHCHERQRNLKLHKGHGEWPPKETWESASQMKLRSGCAFEVNLPKVLISKMRNSCGHSHDPKGFLNNLSIQFSEPRFVFAVQRIGQDALLKAQITRVNAAKICPRLSAQNAYMYTVCIDWNSPIFAPMSGVSTIQALFCMRAESFPLNLSAPTSWACRNAPFFWFWISCREFALSTGSAFTIGSKNALPVCFLILSICIRAAS
mmetsp:Transcript_22352/g.31299  ORF Transcript_22352/g.31299 Transcript_22352/m.31299 type:complete len:209 (+) Transcript_22352:35-661(+)